MNSIEKIASFKGVLLESEETFEGVLGMVQGVVGAAEFSGKDIMDELGTDPTALDEQLLQVAAFILYLRSDDAPKADPEILVNKLPGVIAELVHEAGIA